MGKAGFAETSAGKGALTVRKVRPETPRGAWKQEQQLESQPQGKT